MRKSKVALLCAAAMAAGGYTAMAQNVYSLNVVGYVNLPLTEGFNLVANHMDLDGTGTNNDVISVLNTQMPLNTKVFQYNGVGYNQSTYAKNKTTGATNWTPDVFMNPGMATWVDVPAGAYGGTTQQVATVGNVLQGTLNNPNIPAGGGFAFLGNMVPVGGGVTATLKYQPQLNDKVYVYNGVGYNQSTYAKNKTTGLTNWTPTEPNIAVGTGFWLQTGAGSTWSQNFTVQ